MTLISSQELNPFEAPPQELKDLFKSWRVHSAELIKKHKFNEFLTLNDNDFSKIIPNQLEPVFNEFCSSYDTLDQTTTTTSQSLGKSKIYCSTKIPGLLIAPALLPPLVQKQLLSRLVHRDLSNPVNKTNLHLHYQVSYPPNGGSFFSEDPSTFNFISKDRDLVVKKNLECGKALQKKLRWITLGSQYDWSRKEYPRDRASEIPRDISNLIIGIYPYIKPQAAIVNFYSPGDTLSLHRDVSEKIDRGLVSISLGCDAYFVIGTQNKGIKKTESEVLLLRSGDVLYMTGESRFAWHGVPLIIRDTCPEYLKDCSGGKFPSWKDWISNKRVNLNIRQIWDLI